MITINFPAELLDDTLVVQFPGNPLKYVLHKECPAVFELEGIDKLTICNPDNFFTLKELGNSANICLILRNTPLSLDFISVDAAMRYLAEMQKAMT